MYEPEMNKHRPREFTETFKDENANASEVNT